MRTAKAVVALFRRIGLRRSIAAFLIIFAFSSGFYLAQVYSDISVLIRERRAELTSAIYSAPLTIRVGDEVAALHLDERLDDLSYTRVQNPKMPGEYSTAPGEITVYVRHFNFGTQTYPAQLVHIEFSHGRVGGIADSFGVAMPRAMIEPEVIGRLLPGAPAERVEVTLDELPPFLVKGLLATEDRFFYYHFGFDPVRIVEAAVIDLYTHHLEQGASTITQQLARTFIKNKSRTFRRKIRELAIALVLEMHLTKNQILERYINDVPMGAYDGTPIFGLPMAARYFFNKDLSQVTPAQAATLIGMIQAPTLYNPRWHPRQCRIRRDTVLAIMRRSGLIDQNQYAVAMNTPVEVAPTPGLRRAPYFADYVRSQLAKIPGYDKNLEGVKVYTTLQPELQGLAHAVVVDNLRRLERKYPRLRRGSPAKRLQSALVAINPATGAIVAMVGGRNYDVSQFNRAAEAQRQPGSAFKPIVYVTALDPTRNPLPRPITLATVLPDRPMSFGGWAPADYERTYHGEATVAEALAESLNVPTAYLGSLIGPSNIVKTAHEMGIHEHLPAVLPMVIGSDDMTLLELSGAYAVFADRGVANPPYAIQSVVDGAGHLIYQHEPEPRGLMSHAVSYLITSALQGVLQYGTGADAPRMGLDFPAAGKTGTTDDYRDAYFVGYTRDMVCGVWVGYDEPHSIGLPGAMASLPAWVHFMVGAVRRPYQGFGAPPPGITMASINRRDGNLATAQCPPVATLPFLSGTEPTQLCAPATGGVFAATTPAPAPLLNGPGTSPPPSVANGAGIPPGGTASNSILGAVGEFFSGLFGHRTTQPVATPSAQPSAAPTN